jgi:hypothetical protein
MNKKEVNLNSAQSSAGLSVGYTRLTSNLDSGVGLLRMPLTICQGLLSYHLTTARE